ncbi:unnamed protein product [Parnassius apollo]|uniref:(apollo) hypothetical protein n=1 Tax=Parnassius apollo TaxID=110799 RepID=A0A8S3WQ75_PARAO|nr:unnamed protein product [Parnassius apollo]
MTQQKQEMKNMRAEITKSINENINEKFKNIEIKNLLLEEKIENQQRTIESLDRSLRRRNIIFFGFSEEEKTYHDLEENILELINTHMKANCGTNNIEYMRRLGKPIEKVRPVIITFTTMGKKIELLKKKKLLMSTPYYIQKDFPLEVLQKRKELHVKLKETQEQGIKRK